MDASVISAIVGGIGVIFTAVTSVLIAKYNNRKDLTINDRQQLSKDEQQFRAEMWNRIRVLEEQVVNYQARVIELEDQLRASKIQYTELEIINRRLVAEVEEMKDKLKSTKF